MKTLLRILLFIGLKVGVAAIIVSIIMATIHLMFWLKDIHKLLPALFIVSLALIPFLGGRTWNLVKRIVK